MCHLIYREQFCCKIRHIQHIVEVPIVKIDLVNPFGGISKLSAMRMDGPLYGCRYKKESCTEAMSLEEPESMMEEEER